MSSLRDSCYLCGIIAAARAKNGALKQFPIANQEFLVFGALFFPFGGMKRTGAGTLVVFAGREMAIWRPLKDVRR
jgi:hypothetical protein